jgi:hypothetical protein
MYNTYHLAEDDEFKVDTFNDSINELSDYKTDHYDLLLIDAKS